MVAHAVPSPRHNADDGAAFLFWGGLYGVRNALARLLVRRLFEIVVWHAIIFRHFGPQKIWRKNRQNFEADPSRIPPINHFSRLIVCRHQGQRRIRSRLASDLVAARHPALLQRAYHPPQGGEVTDKLAETMGCDFGVRNIVTLARGELSIMFQGIGLIQSTGASTRPRDGCLSLR